MLTLLKLTLRRGNNKAVGGKWRIKRQRAVRGDSSETRKEETGTLKNGLMYSRLT
ncbi:hypothetical protein [Intestinirhabdus alba]|jgi:hypothetical protein|uniref:Uncharacterized protein n=1 Tax=Intestinirhabdus alba TaxID=2899544 RepID=A0A6L6ILX1_9ENTR|nr:hypothetical protein [Intestinirhabdus alba]MTH46867.1 hypothetical protein [Intestinirhabdus alba]